MFILTFVFISIVSLAWSTGPIECESGQTDPKNCDRLKILLNDSNMNDVLGTKDATVKNINNAFQRTTYIGNYYDIKATVLVNGKEEICCFQTVQRPWTQQWAKFRVTCGQCGACKCFKDTNL